MRLALYQPDIAGNVGTILRLAACFGVPCDIIHPCGFAFSDRALKRSGMDYAAQADVHEHDDWIAFEATATQNEARIILMSSKASTPLHTLAFLPNDIILMGSESSGAPQSVHARADARIHIPMQAGFRSLNVSVAAGIALAEGLRQTGQFPVGANP
jgi:tRNA (cytidine/uridine-2'-O-)-methyltransferase